MRYQQIGISSLLALLALPITLAVPLHSAGPIAPRATASSNAASAWIKHAWYDHHAQQQWLYGQRTAPGTKIPAGAWLRALQQRSSVPQVSVTTPWTAIGPAPTGPGPYNHAATSGRVSALAYDATHNIVYAGAANGGLWKSTDGGATWTPLSDTQPSLAVGAIALDPNNLQTIYVGTGEENFNVDAYYSAGILKSTDGGTTWTVLGQSMFGIHNLRCPTGTGCGGPHIGKIAVDPNNSANVLVASDIGLWRSTDGGTTWSAITTCPTNNFITDLIVDGSSNPSRVYAACGFPLGSSSNGFYKSTDGGVNFSPTFTPGTLGRVAIAMAPSSPSTLYLVASSPSNPSSQPSLGMWQSTDQGATWVQVTPAFSSGGPDLFGTDVLKFGPSCSSLENEQGSYDMYAAVDPASASTVYVGGINVFKSTDAGATFTDVTNVYSLECGNPCPTNICIHPDQHALVFTGPGSFYAGNDGGVYSSTDGGSTWSDNNGNLAITQFYAGSTTANFPANPVIYGGTQDNGTQKYTGSPGWAEVLGGDGGFTANDPNNPDTAYTELHDLYLAKTTDGGITWTLAITGIQQDLRIEPRLFEAPFVMDPTNPNHLLAGTDHLYETIDGATSWTEKSPSLAASTSNPFGAISAIAIAPSDPNNTFYVGTGDGKIWVTTNDGGSWTDITAGTVGTTGRYVTALAVNPTNASDVDVAFSGFSGAIGGHVYTSTNGGKTWSDISTGLPDTPVNAIVRDPTNAPVRYIGTDVGFFFTTDGGASWQQDQTGLPNTSINQLFTDKNFTTFVVATHGRGMFTLPVSALRPPPNTPTPVPATNKYIGQGAHRR